MPIDLNLLLDSRLAEDIAEGIGDEFDLIGKNNSIVKFCYILNQHDFIPNKSC